MLVRGHRWRRALSHAGLDLTTLAVGRFDARRLTLGGRTARRASTDFVVVRLDTHGLPARRANGRIDGLLVPVVTIRDVVVNLEVLGAW